MSHLELPPGEKWQLFELQGLGLRDFGRAKPDRPLDPFALARFANLLVVKFDEIKTLSAESREHLLGPGAQDWSGGACSIALPNGQRIVILNPTHGPARTNATLMEEISHVFLGHQANRLKAVDETGKTLARDYRQSDEEAAYATGAAALVPFGSLRKAVLAGRSSLEIARHFRVSRELVEYRLKVTRLWRTYRTAHPAEKQPPQT